MKIKSHFFGKDCIIDRALKNRSNLDLAVKEVGISAKNILMLSQIHSANVEVIDSPEKIYGTENLPKADAIATNLPNVALAVVTADCSPILFFDEEKKIIGAAHAGWRGAKAGVIANTISEMKKLGATKIKAKIGPMIHAQSYEVSQDFLENFLTENSANQKFFFATSKPEKYLFDLVAYVENKLQESGISEIENCQIDTYQNENSFFSFRRSTHRQESDCGRNVSVIALN